MGLLPEDTAAQHLSKQLDAAHESGVPRVWRSIEPWQVQKWILSKISLAEVMAIDHSVIHDSYWLSRKKGDKWWPWFMAEVVMDRKEAAWEKEKERERADAQKNILATVVAETLDIDAEYERERKWRDSLTTQQKEAIVRKRMSMLQCRHSIPTNIALRSEWRDMNEQENRDE